MLEKFTCPDGVECTIEQCLAECRLKSVLECGRCISRRILAAVSKQRTWNGVPTVTQLITGTRAEYLKITRGYAANPQSLVAAYFGSKCHASLEDISLGLLCEMRLKDPTDTYSGQFDCYDVEEQVLYDTKTFGSFKTAQVLGLEKVKTPIVDPVTGEVETTKTGRMKYRTHYVRGVRLMRDVTLQLNAYRIMLEHAGYPVKEMRLEVIVRDGGTWIANDRGVDRNALLVKVNRVDDRLLQKFMLEKAKLLSDAVNSNKMPPPCRPIECWGGLKCKGYCSVKKFCEGSFSR